ncbi:MAG: tetratricopeptide repeat protein, partial [Cyanobacteria bacterium J06635_13]
MMWLAGLIICLGWIISLCFHEFAHALVAYCGGDTSVKDKRYLTFNPLKYTQPGLLSLLMPLVCILIGGIGLPGGAVYINHKLLRDRAWSSWVSAAGPVASLMFALLLVNIFRILASIRSDQEWVIVALPSVAYLIYIEFGAVLLNLFPIPPLDGSGIIQPWLPAKINQQLEQYSNFSYYFIFGLFLFVPGFGSFFSGILRSICKFLGVAPVAIGYGSDLFNLPVNKLITILILAIIAYSLRFNEATWYRKGHKLAVSKKDQEAIAAYEQAIKIQPKYLDAWLGKADALFRLGLYAESAIAYETAFSLTTKQDFHSSSKYLIQALLHIGKLEQAINIADQGIAEDPQEYCFWECKAACLYKQEKYQPVIDLCRAGIETCGDRIWLNYYLAASLKRLNQYQAARAI